MNRLWLVTAVLLFGACTVREPADTDRPVRQIFAEHDCCGRLPDTSINRIGVLRTDDRQFDIYELYFVNPASEQGMTRVAIVEKTKFIGSYQTDGAVISIKGDELHFSCRKEDRDWCGPENHQTISFASDRLPQEVLINGTVWPLDDTI